MCECICGCAIILVVVYIVFGGVFFSTTLTSRFSAIWGYIWPFLVTAFKFICFYLLLVVGYKLTLLCYSQAYDLRQLLLDLRNSAQKRKASTVLAKVIGATVPILGVVGLLLVLKYAFADWWVTGYAIHSCILAVSALPLMFPDNLKQAEGWRNNDAKVLMFIKCSFSLYVAYGLYLRYVI